MIAEIHSANDRCPGCPIRTRSEPVLSEVEGRTSGVAKRLATRPHFRRNSHTVSRATLKLAVPRRVYELDPEVSAATAKLRFLKQLVCSDAPEQALRYHGFRSIAGVDEVGRGALFGPVVAAAVILPKSIGALARAGLKDSKQLDRKQRERLDRRIRRLAMLLAVRGLALAPDHLLIDAVRIDHDCPQTKLYYGDSLSLSIAAASVIAKVYRDALMRELDEVHPGYGLASHKGYATPEHRRSLRELGPCPLHRKTFAPVRALIPGEPIPETALLFNDDPDAADPNYFADDPLIADALAEPSLDDLLHQPTALA